LSIPTRKPLRHNSYETGPRHPASHSTVGSGRASRLGSVSTSHFPQLPMALVCHRISGSDKIPTLGARAPCHRTGDPYHKGRGRNNSLQMLARQCGMAYTLSGLVDHLPCPFKVLFPCRRNHIRYCIMRKFNRRSSQIFARCDTVTVYL